MSQQVNLCSPLLLTQKRYFSANAMASSLAAFVLLGGALCAFWVWSLSSSSDELNRTLTMHAKEQETLQAAIRAGQAGAGTMMTNMAQDLDTVRAQLAQREHLLEELQRGLLREGQGHSVRMRMVAQTIPAQVWVTEVLAEEKKLEVRGFTLEPVALDEWVARLALNPGLQGQALSAIKVERVTEEAKDAPAGAARAQPTWAFTLVSSVLASSPNTAGGRP